MSIKQFDYNIGRKKIKIYLLETANGNKIFVDKDLVLSQRTIEKIKKRFL
jgi:hypothetical protein